MVEEKICYVIMPFSKTESTSEEEWNKIYFKLFKPIIEESKFNYVCKRSELENGSFTKEIVLNLKNADLVFVDLTDFNLNVMWELGVRHALSKRTIMVAKKEMIEKIPSDIKNYGVIPYTNSISHYNEFKENIHKLLENISKNPEKSDSPVYDFLNDSELIFSDIERRKIINKLKGLLSELLTNLKICDDVSTNTLKIQKDNITYRRYYANALNHLLVTNYFPVKEEFLQKLFYIVIFVENSNLELDHALFDSATNLDTSRNYLQEVSKRYKPEIEEAIKEIKKILNQVQNGEKYNDVESPIFLLDDKYKQLLEGDENK